MVGIDEVGRGAWAGPLLVAAVRLNEEIAGLRDSKLLNSAQRLILADEISRKADIGFGWISAARIDQLGLARALRLASLDALARLGVDKTESIIIDGNINYVSDLYAISAAVIKADQTIACVSAASIVAKVARDAFMIKQAKRYPLFGFERHVGYGTKTHVLALEKFGICKLHRKSYKPVQAYL